MVRPAWTARFSSGAHIKLGLQAEDEVQRPHRADGGCRLGADPRPTSRPSPPALTPQGQVTPGLFLRPPAAGSVPHIYTKGATAYYSRAGWPVCGGGLGRPAVVPPAGRVREWPRPCRGAGEGRVGRFRRKRRGRCGPRGLVPYREVAAAWEPLVPVGTVCHRPVPGPLSGLPGGVGMARGT